MADVEFYFERFGWGEPLELPSPEAGLSMVVVIPCRNEPDLVGSLRSLQGNEPIDGVCEVIVVINDQVGGTAGCANADSAEQAREWYAKLSDPFFALHVMEMELPKKKAGVGLARKVGMDEAVRRLDQVGNSESGVIVCYDADCRCDSNLLRELECFFADHSRAPGCSVHYEHPLDGELGEAISQYELHLRYYIEACRYAGHPFAFHTIGSSMAVRADKYVEQGGMNKRQAGEDFYFLQKIIPLGNFGEVNSTRVLPSARVSDRVPFGTGRAVGEFLHAGNGHIDSYPIEAFHDLRRLFENVMAGMDVVDDGVSVPLARFLEEQEFASALKAIRKQTSNAPAFQKRFFRWFDAFKVMKYVHFARDTAYGTPPVNDVAARLWSHLTAESGDWSSQELLVKYRVRQRKGWTSPLD